MSSLKNIPISLGLLLLFSSIYCRDIFLLFPHGLLFYRNEDVFLRAGLKAYHLLNIPIPTCVDLFGFPTFPSIPSAKKDIYCLRSQSIHLCLCSV